VSLTGIGLFIIAVVAAVAGVFALFRAFDDRAAPPIVIEDAAVIRPVVVDVRGAVDRPGVVELPPGARVQDAVAAAGGLSTDADLATINLARRLRDGEVVVIGYLPGSDASPATTQRLGDIQVTASSGQRVNINSASAAELEELPGIGEVTAGRIIEFREANGPFRTVDDLVHVEGISMNTIDGFRELVTVGP
jgi:competence protein ComEA